MEFTMVVSGDGVKSLIIPSCKADTLSDSLKGQNQQDLLRLALWHDLIRRNPAYLS